MLAPGSYLAMVEGITVSPNGTELWAACDLRKTAVAYAY